MSITASVGECTSGPSGELLAAIVTAALGLFGVAVTLISNAIRARQRDAKSLRIFRASVSTQLDQLVDNIERELEYVSRNNDTIFTVIDYFDAFRTNAGKVGELKEDELRNITVIFYKYQDAMARLLATIEKSGSPIAWGSAYKIDFSGKITKEHYTSTLRDLLKPAGLARAVMRTTKPAASVGLPPTSP